MLLIPNEAIIETFACILNTVFYSIESEGGSGTVSPSWINNLKRDQAHSLLLLKKIIDKQGDGLWDEKTHSFCYIVFKTILYVYFNTFLKIYRYRNDTVITDFLIRYSTKTYKKAFAVSPKKNHAIKLKQTVFSI